jgi:hypothetical protein
MRSRVLPVMIAAAGLLAGGVAANALAGSSALASGGVAPARAQAAAADVAPTPAPSGSTGTPGQPPGRAGGRGHGWGGPMGPMGGPGHGLGAGGPVLHGEFVVQAPGGTTTTVIVQTGTITARGANGITVRSTDGYTLAWVLDSSTSVRTGWAAGSVKDLAVGDAVRAEGTRQGGTVTARSVGERPAGRAAGQKAGPSTTPGAGQGTRPGAGAPMTQS